VYFSVTATEALSVDGTLLLLWLVQEGVLRLRSLDEVLDFFAGEC